MYFSSFTEMQKAVNIVLTSPHPVNKIAATVFGSTPDGKPYSLSSTNYWPEPILKAMGAESRIGNSSGTVHAETNCLFKAPYTNGASICVTDPFCPNCAKNMAEAGIKTIYIDHKGFDKDFAARRGDHFTSMSMRICEKAGMNVYRIHRKKEKLVPILEIPDTFIPTEDSPVDITPSQPGDYDALVKDALKQHRNRRFALCIAQNLVGEHFAIIARTHPAVGYSLMKNRDEIESEDSKYSFILEPLNRLLMNASRHGLSIIDGTVYSSQVPSSRELVNYIGAGLNKITIHNVQSSRDSHGIKALAQLQDAGILTVLSEI